MIHVIPIHVAMDSVLRVADHTNVIVILDTLVQHVMVSYWKRSVDRNNVENKI